MKPIIIVQGGQYGSEAKGAITAHLCRNEGVNWCVRTGATNAGHTVYHHGKKFSMQQLPVGWVNPNTFLAIGAGSLVDLDILNAEVAAIKAQGYDTSQIYIDHRAFIHDTTCATRSAMSGRSHAIGATGKGCSEAMVDRIRGRGEGAKTIGQLFGDNWRGIKLIDTEKLLNHAFDSGMQILLEGTQGTLLDLCLGPYPYTTHKQTGPAQWLMEVGLSPALPTNIVMVVRTYPIRVAGNSGPFPGETTWPALARAINRKRAAVQMPPLVVEAAVVAFEEAVVQAAEAMMPAGSGDMNPLEQHKWTAEQRLNYAAALRDINTEALKLLNAMDRAEMAKLVEMTTVTKRLRRIAELDIGDLETAARQVRPHRVAVTFMDYAFPGGIERSNLEQVGAYVDNIGEACGAPVTTVSWGPNPEDIVGY